MIRINLLPVRAAQKKEHLKSQLVILVLSLIVTVFICATVYMSLSAKVDEVREEISQKEAEAAQLRKKIGEVSRVKKLQEELRGKLDVLDKLKAQRTGPVRLLDELSKVMPERVWINSFSESGGSVSIAGVGLNEETVAEFLQRLEASDYYRNVELQVIEKDTNSGRTVEKFSIVCRTEQPVKASEKKGN